MSAKLIYKTMCPQCGHVSYVGLDDQWRCEQPCCADNPGGRPALCMWTETGEVFRGYGLLIALQQQGRGISFVPPSWDYPACPDCPAGTELVEVRLPSGLTRVLCYNAFSRSGCNYIAPAREASV